MLASAAFPSFFLTLAGFILFLLTTLSVPIIKTIYLLHIEYPNGSPAANIGMLGTCYKGGDAKILGISYSGVSECTDPKVGFELDTSLFGLQLGSDATRVVIKGLAGSLILNAVAAGAAGISLFFAFFAWFCASRVMEIFLFITLFGSSLIGWIAFWLDLALILVARKRIGDYTDGAFSGHIGNALWIALAGAAALSGAICLSGCGMFGRYSNSNRYTHRDAAPVAPVVGEKPYRRRFFWQKDPAYRGTY